MNEKKKGNGGLVVALVLFIIISLGLGCFIVYDKFLSDNKSTTEKASINEKKEKNETEIKEEKEETTSNKTNSIEIRECTGVYSGNAAITMDARTGQYGTGILTIELKSDGTYELKKGDMTGAVGNYTIIENALLLKTTPETTGPEADTSAKYTQYLNISNDCSSISMGYGSYFFDSNFTLTKQG